MPLLVVGSVGLDSIETPHGKVEEVLGGSAVYFSWAANFFTPVRLVGVVGNDFPKHYRELLSKRSIDTAGLKELEGKTFRWRGRYQGTMHSATTLSVELNVFGQYEPRIPETFRDSRFVFLANGLPSLQQRVLEQMKGPEFVAADTMNHWINEKKAELLEVLKRIDALILNDEEARQLTGESNLIKAARRLQAIGPKYIIIKKGEHGAVLTTPEGFFLMPGFPTENVKDPTGAGDSFAGGLMGYLAKKKVVTEGTLKQAIVYGTIIASFNVEDFSIQQLQRITLEDIEERRRKFEAMVRFH
ncbi:MAG TPA: PfkB family carbohydrate kinase [Candidatus Hypogeohydataceae bacterium YC41]